MITPTVNRSRRNLLVQGASLIGAGIGGSMLTPLMASCQTSKPAARKTGGQSKYLKYKDKLDRCFSAVLQDVMDGMNVRVQCMNPRIKPLLPTMKTWGEAVTIYLEEVTRVPEKPFQMEMELLDDTVEGQIIVAQCNARNLCAFWGGLLTNAAVGHKLAGVIIDGGARDYSEIVELNFPTFCVGLSRTIRLDGWTGRSVMSPSNAAASGYVPAT